MNFLRLLGLLLVIVLVGFFIQHYHLNFSALKNSTNVIEQKVGQKIEEFLPPPLRGGDPSTPAKSGVISLSGIIVTTNKERATNGNLKPLTENARLDLAAAAKVQDMFNHQYFEHTSPSGRGPSDLAKTAGYEYILIGENLALGNFSDNQDLLTAWMNSPGHRANILNNRFSEMGAAASMGMYEGKKVWLAVQEFGLPLSSCPAIDSTLQIKIEGMKNDLNAKEEVLQAKKKEIDNADPKSGDAYNAKVAEYNQIIADYNARIREVKVNIDTYNAEVRAFNNCAETPS